MTKTFINLRGREIPVLHLSAAVSRRLDFATGQILNAEGGFSVRRL